MNILFYDALHITGAICLFLGLGGYAGVALIDATDEAKKKATKYFAIFHGVGLLLLLVAGFGALAKLNLGFPPWVMVKVVLWVFFGASMVLFKRIPQMAKIWILLVPAVGILAIYLGTYKPF